MSVRESAVNEWQEAVAYRDFRAIHGSNLRRCGMCHQLSVAAIWIQDERAVRERIEMLTGLGEINGEVFRYPICEPCCQWLSTQHPGGAEDVWPRLASFMSVRAFFDLRIHKDIGMTTNVKFYRSGQMTAIWTDATELGAFFEATAERLAEVLAHVAPPDEVPALLSCWLVQIHDLACKLKGYKTEEVQEQRVLIAGTWTPSPDAEVR